MYVTRRLSELLKNPESLSEPPEGPNSGFLVIKDEVTVNWESGCFGWFKHETNRVNKLPFPQNMDLTLSYRANNHENNETRHVWMIFIPVLNQPLSSDVYYAICPQGQNKGKALTSSEPFVPVSLNPQNVFQHVKIVPYNDKFYAVASGGLIWPYGLPEYTWSADTSTPFQFELDEALGVDFKLCASLPNFNISIACKNPKPVIVGKWYVPFMFVKEGRLRDQVERSLYYHVTLEQRWERIFTCKKSIVDKENLVEIDVEVNKQEAFIAGNKALWSEKNVDDGVIWFTSYETEGGDLSVGLRVEVVERMKWEQGRGGWKDENERTGRVKRVEEFKGEGDWNEFGCYVLVERFNMRRMDGSLAMVYDFKHIHQIKTLWE